LTARGVALPGFFPPGLRDPKEEIMKALLIALTAFAVAASAVAQVSVETVKAASLERDARIAAIVGE